MENIINEINIIIIIIIISIIYIIIKYVVIIGVMCILAYILALSIINIFKILELRRYNKYIEKTINEVNLQDNQKSIQQVIDIILKINAKKCDKNIAFILNGNKEEIVNVIFMELVASNVEVYKIEEIESINCDDYEIICNITVNT
nr:hypothetical protein [uncultured Tyzzerella sp.]